MERTIDHPALEHYSRTFSDRILDQAYARRDKVDGQAILSLSPVKQVNFFVVKALFDRWQQELERLRSPYFDYDHQEVQEAIEEFMNVLSQHIAVAEPELKPLLQAATHDTLLLLLAPATYYLRTLEKTEHSRLHAEDVKEWAKYVKIHRAPLEQLTIDDESGIATEEANRRLQEAAHALQPEEPSEYLSLFSQVASVSEEDLVEATYPSVDETDDATEEPALPEEEPAPDSPSEEEIPALKTLNDELSPSQKATLADLHRQQKIENIKTYIGVNQRFMFIRELFNNNTETYNRALDELEQKNTYIEAFNHLRNEYAQPHRWKMDSEEVVEFLEIVAKRF